MKKFITYLLICIPLLLSAQSKKGKPQAKHNVPKQSIDQFYAKHQLIPDSACNPYLYYQVFDWLGTHYRYAGKTKKGIDCSGFVSEMYRCAYCINLQGGSKDIWPLVKQIEKPDLQEGDILFFKIKKGQISHVGVYLGNNKFAHASVGYGVIVSDLDEEYYKKHFYKGGRIQ